AFMKGVFSGAVEPVFAILAMLAATYVYPAMPWLLSFSAGAMLYVSVSELLPEARGASGNYAYIGGFAFMMLLDTALG
ncbi:MAG: ZIP family metal transporter, partial [Oscillospiraceae bacterium]|nr:ZIP family metal transporter [Oscillospiraceae bacterium]